MGVDSDKLVFESGPGAAADGAHAIVVLTEWDGFKGYNYQEFYNTMQKPAFFRRPRHLEAWGFGGYRLRGTHHWQGSIQGWKVDAVAKLDGNGVAREISAVGRNLCMHASSSSDKRGAAGWRRSLVAVLP